MKNKLGFLTLVVLALVVIDFKPHWDGSFDRMCKASIADDDLFRGVNKQTDRVLDENWERCASWGYTKENRDANQQR